jgi:hypothetical protein
MPPTDLTRLDAQLQLCNCPTSKATTRPWPPKLPSSSAHIWIIWSNWLRAFIATQTNVVLIGNVGIGKTHLSIALGRAACLNGHSVLFTTAVDIINTLAAAQSAGRLKREFQRYFKPAVLIVTSSVTCPSTSMAQTCCSDHQPALRARSDTAPPT